MQRDSIIATGCSAIILTREFGATGNVSISKFYEVFLMEKAFIICENG